MENEITQIESLTIIDQLLKDCPFLPESTLNILRNVEAASKMNAPLKVFDWNRAEILIKEAGAVNAGGCLEGDESFTSDLIWIEGKPHLDSWFYPCSIWATPMLVINGEKIPCFTTLPNEPDLIAEIDLPDPSVVWPDYQTKRLE